MNDAWIKDIMSQRFLNSDLSRLIMLRAMIKEGVLREVYKKSDIMEYIYRTYSDHSNTRDINPDPKIRNIKRYGLSDVKYVLDNALKEWSEYAVNGILVFDERYIYIKEIDDSGYQLATLTLQLCNMLQKKYFSISIENPINLNPDECIKDYDMNNFGKGTFRDRVFEDMQYCPLCEETRTNLLRAVHIPSQKHNGLAARSHPDKTASFPPYSADRQSS